RESSQYKMRSPWGAPRPEWNARPKDAKRGPAAMRIASEFVAGLVTIALTIAGSAGCRGPNASDGAAISASAQAPEVKDVVLPAIDTSAMTPRERHIWSKLVSSLLAPCPTVPVSVAQCVEDKRACGTCVQAAKWLAGAVREGASDTQIDEAYKVRFGPEGIKILPIDGAPTKGPDNAPVTIVEFADFECPHCRAAVPIVDAVMANHQGKVRLVYKTYTLSFHTRGVPAARAALAAGVQGKFWEMEHILFERQEHLEDSDLERYAEMLRLDIPRWKADMTSPAVDALIASSQKLGDEIKLKGTPSIFVNGRELDLEEDESLEVRVAGELGVPPVPPPGLPPTNAPDAGAAAARP
ncbi:MAG: DsbA family protein, partial [Polyangiaceae bacterium]